VSERGVSYRYNNYGQLFEAFDKLLASIKKATGAFEAFGVAVAEAKKNERRHQAAPEVQP
jgi:hypothetical protein